LEPPMGEALGMRRWRVDRDRREGESQAEREQLRRS